MYYETALIDTSLLQKKVGENFLLFRSKIVEMEKSTKLVKLLPQSCYGEHKHLTLQRNNSMVKKNQMMKRK